MFDACCTMVVMLYAFLCGCDVCIPLITTEDMPVLTYYRADIIHKICEYELHVDFCQIVYTRINV